MVNLQAPNKEFPNVKSTICVYEHHFISYNIQIVCECDLLESYLKQLPSNITCNFVLIWFNADARLLSDAAGGLILSPILLISTLKHGHFFKNIKQFCMPSFSKWL